MADRRLLEYSLSRLRYKTSEVRIKSIEELRALNDPAGWEAIERIFAEDQTPEVHRAAQSALIFYYTAWLRVVDASVRLKAIEGLRRVGDGSVLPALEHIYNTDANPDVRKAARDAGFDLYNKSRKPTN